MAKTIFVVSGPSGAGKTTLVDYALTQVPSLRKVITTTTRPPRTGEINGRDYYFTTSPEFEQGIAQGEFIEHANVYGKYYGSSFEELARIRNQGQFPLYLIDVQGARTIKERFSESSLVFIKTPTIQELGKRLRARGQDSEETILRRLKQAEEELKSEGFFDYTIITENRITSGNQFVDFIRSRLH